MKKSKPSPVAPRNVEAKPGGPMTLSLDIGGTGLKASVLDASGAMVHDRVRIPTDDDATPTQMIEAFKKLASDLPAFDRVSAGFPGAVRDGRIVTAPHFPDPAWVGFDLAAALAAAFGKPARVGNDADVQGMAVIKGKGIEMVLTLGTGAGTSVFRDGVLGVHLELAHHPVHGKKTYNDYVGNAALKKVEVKRWSKRVHRIVAILFNLVHYDHLFIGGGNADKVLGALDPNVTIVSNDAGIKGGVALWNDPSGR